MKNQKPSGKNQPKKTQAKNQANNQAKNQSENQAKKICEDLRFSRTVFSPPERVRLKVEKREIARWSGVLMGTPRFRHLLICKHLRSVEEDESPWVPEHLKAIATHEWWCWYQYRNQSLTDARPVKILFHQYSDLDNEGVLVRARASHPTWLRSTAIFRAEQSLDQRAADVTMFIAQIMMDLSLIRTQLPNVSFAAYLVAPHLLHGIDDPHNNMWADGSDEALEEFWASIIDRAIQKYSSKKSEKKISDSSSPDDSTVDFSSDGFSTKFSTEFNTGFDEYSR